MPHERRRHPRFEVQGIVGSFEQKLRFAVRILGLGGMLVETTRELAPGEQGRFTVELPGEGVLGAHGRVLYVGPSRPGAYRIGVAFDSLPINDRVVLESFLVGRAHSD